MPPSSMSARGSTAAPWWTPGSPWLLRQIGKNCHLSGAWHRRGAGAPAQGPSSSRTIAFIGAPRSGGGRGGERGSVLSMVSTSHLHQDHRWATGEVHYGATAYSWSSPAPCRASPCRTASRVRPVLRVIVKRVDEKPGQDFDQRVAAGLSMSTIDPLGWPRPDSLSQLTPAEAGRWRAGEGAAAGGIPCGANLPGRLTRPRSTISMPLGEGTDSASPCRPRGRGAGPACRGLASRSLRRRNFATITSAAGVPPT